MIQATTEQEIHKAIAAGLKPLRVSPPLRLSEWAADHFYLSAESSYAEGQWVAYPYQTAIMDAISNDEIREVDWQKAARTGYTKIILASMGYFSQHKRRNQAVWQPTDDDIKEFVKTELDPMYRDVEVMAEVFPAHMARAKENTLKQKMLIGSTVHLRGGKAAKNYRRITIDVAFIDELDAFDLDVEGEGSPDMLSAKRLEGATFPKHIMGSTPHMRGFSLIEARVQNAKMRFSFRIPCPLCDAEQPLTWGGIDKTHGFKWQDNDPATVAHQCHSCGQAYTQAEYLSVWNRGRWVSEDGIWIDADGEFRSADGARVDPPESIAFAGLWTAYSPQASWVSIVQDWINARKKAKSGDMSAQKTFTNTTLGETWEEEVERTDKTDLASRAEEYRLRSVPMGGLVLVAGVDVQADRFEMVVWAFGIGEEMWVIDYSVIDANPADPEDWKKLDAYVQTEFPHEAGAHLKIDAVAVDTGGHYTHQAYNYCRERSRRRVYAIKGDNKYGQPIKGKATAVDVNWASRIIKRGVKLWHVGTDTAKDLLYGRLQLKNPGPGMVHFSKDLPPDFYAQITAEARVLQKTSTGEYHRWICPPGVRNEVLDCTVYALFSAQMLDLHKYTARQWEMRENLIIPQEILEKAREPKEPDQKPAIERQNPQPKRQPPRRPVHAGRPRRGNFVSGWRS